jgi:sirohydrochlorin cobaltochelatase
VICDDERMAAWMMRAILVENVIVRREANILYMPAGPAFRVEKEIKNVITSIAKTVHYWRAHLRSRQPPKPL